MAGGRVVHGAWWCRQAGAYLVAQLVPSGGALDDDGADKQNARSSKDRGPFPSKPRIVNRVHNAKHQADDKSPHQGARTTPNANHEAQRRAYRDDRQRRICAECAACHRQVRLVHPVKFFVVDLIDSDDGNVHQHRSQHCLRRLLRRQDDGMHLQDVTKLPRHQSHRGYAHLYRKRKTGEQLAPGKARF